MKVDKIKIFFLIILIAVLIWFGYCQYKVLSPRTHGMRQITSFETPAEYYDADKKKWVSQAEWLSNYKELPKGYLPKEEWDKKKRDDYVEPK